MDALTRDHADELDSVRVRAPGEHGDDHVIAMTQHGKIDDLNFDSVDAMSDDEYE